MKRPHDPCPDFPDPSPSARTTVPHENPPRVFNVANASSSSASADINVTSGVAAAEEAVQSMTVEQFERLNAEERYNHFQNQAYEIKQLRRKIRKCCKARAKALEKSLRHAEEVIRAGSFELEDQRNMPEQLISAISQELLAPGTLPFDRICTVLRNVLNTRIDKKSAKYLPLIEKKLAITEREREEYSYLPHNAAIFGILAGQPASQPAVEMDPQRIAEQYVRMQGEMLKRLTYTQFVDMTKKLKGW